MAAPRLRYELEAPPDIRHHATDHRLHTSEAEKPRRVQELVVNGLRGCKLAYGCAT